MNDDQRLLASAALDGAVTSEERARAEADPEVVAEIERLRAVRAALRVDVAPDADRREVSIAAALAAFEATPRPASLEARRRNRWMAPLAAAAAIAALAVGAVVVVQDGDSNDEDLASTEATVMTQAAADTAGAGESELAPQVAAPEGAEESDAAAEAPAGTEATEGTEATSPQPRLDATAPAATAMETLRTPDDLADFARRALAVDGAPTASDGGCALGRTLGTAYYLVGGTEVFVEVVEVADPHEALAVELDRCTVLARAPLP